MGCLKLKVKQGEEKSVGFTIKQNGEAKDLTDYTVHFQVKRTPVVTSKPIVDKYITTNSDINKAGQITNPTVGEFQVHLNEEDTSYPTGDYYLIISLEQYSEDDEISYCDIISSECCNSAKYIICEQ